MWRRLTGCTASPPLCVALWALLHAVAVSVSAEGKHCTVPLLVASLTGLLRLLVLSRKAFSVSALEGIPMPTSLTNYLGNQHRASSAAETTSHGKIVDSLQTKNLLFDLRCGWNSEEEKSTLKNSAFVFIKPHAQTEAVRDYVRSALIKKIPGVKIKSEFSISGKDIDRKKLIDKHYYAIASKATILTPDKIPVPADKFEDFFGEDWNKVLKEGRAVNAMQACKKFECDEATLDDAWREAESKSKVVKLGGGFYCGLVSVGSKAPLYVFNAFFMKMRAKFVGEGSSIYCFEIEWEPTSLRWKDFRSKVLGPTDPARAPRGSIRRTILKRYKEFGLESPPDNGDNGVHASASPFEGLVERTNWASKKYAEDALGMALLERGMTLNQLMLLASDPQVKLADGTTASTFDTLEDLDVSECLEKLDEMHSML